jgi:glutathione S-transferase
VPQHFRDAKNSADYLAVNPNGRIPALVDGDLVLFESMAINLYLAKTYGGDLYPRDAAGEARAWQWSVWAISEIEPLQMQIVIQKLFVPADKRDQTLIDNAAKGLERPLQVLDKALAKSFWLLGDRFTVADLNVAAVLMLLDMVQQDYSRYTHVKSWMTACQSRPALARARAKA